MNDDSDKIETTPEKPTIPQFPVDRIELNDIPEIPRFPQDREERGQKPSDFIKKEEK